MAFLWDFIKIPPRAEHITAFIIHSRTRFPLWRLKLATVNIKGTNTHKHLVDSRQGKIKYTADAIIELRALITCNWPYTDLSDSTKLLTVLITICYWIPRPPRIIRMRGAELALHIIRLSGHIPPRKLQGLDPMPQWLVLNLSKCWGKTKPAAVREYEEPKKGWGHFEIVLH